MTDDPEAKAKRNKLLGRALLIGMGLLILAQMIPYSLSLFEHTKASPPFSSRAAK